MIDDADDYYEISAQKTVCARKPHACDVCRAPISTGEQYQRNTGLMYGHWDTWKYCSWCVENPLAWLMEECGGYCHGGQQEDLEEHRDEMSYRGASFEEWMRWARTVIGLRRRLRQVSAS